MCGLDPNKLHRPDRLQDTNKTHLVNILKVNHLRIVLYALIYVSIEDVYLNYCYLCQHKHLAPMAILFLSGKHIVQPCLDFR
jgi:hypothetical protein